MRIGVLEHEPDAPAGYFGDWGAERGHELVVLEVPALERWPAQLDHDVIVSLGSERSVHASPDAWIEREIGFVRDAHERHTPVFGICFGGQVLAAALGGRVSRAERQRAEWRVIVTSEPRVIPPGPWLRWHEDVFTLPPDARLLAGTAEEPLAFAAGTSVGLQFHPEATPEIVEGWIANGRERLAAEGIDADELRGGVRRDAPEARSRAFGLFDVISAQWARPS